MRRFSSAVLALTVVSGSVAWASAAAAFPAPDMPTPVPMPAPFPGEDPTSEPAPTTPEPSTPAPTTTSSPAPAPTDDAPRKEITLESSVRINTGCSAALVRFEQTDLSGKALVLTNGHCMSNRGMPKAGDVVVNKPTRVTASVLDAAGEKVMLLSGGTVLYGTMDLTDVALFQMDQTFADIKDKTGIEPLLIANRKPQSGDPITIPSAHWKRTFQCPVMKEVHTVKEDAWVWKEAIRFMDDCGTGHGTSGSPMVDERTGEIIGISNTGSDNGEECTMNNPCEVDEDGNVFYEKGTNYGTQTQWFYTCLTDSGQIDLAKDGCKLAKPDGESDELPGVSPRGVSPSDPSEPFPWSGLDVRVA